LGLERYLDGLGLSLTRTQVGDRYVVEAMREKDFNLGGEQSGHVILGDHGTTGDGLIAALQVLATLVVSGGRASETCRVFEPLPQILRNIPLDGGLALEDEAVCNVIAAGTKRLGKKGRLLVRESGTEPLIRVMAEGEDAALINSVVDDIAAVIAAVIANEDG